MLCVWQLLSIHISYVEQFFLSVDRVPESHFCVDFLLTYLTLATPNIQYTSYHTYNIHTYIISVSFLCFFNISTDVEEEMNNGDDPLHFIISKELLVHIHGQHKANVVTCPTSFAGQPIYVRTYIYLSVEQNMHVCVYLFISMYI